MSSENRKITVLICDSNPFFLNSNEGHVRSYMDRAGLPYEVFSYPDGKPALDYLTERKHARDVILITGGYMPFSGWDLLSALDEKDLLPDHCAVCSEICHDVFSCLIRKFLPEEKAGKVAWLMKNVSGVEIGRFLETACGVLAESLEVAKRPTEMPETNVEDGQACSLI